MKVKYLILGAGPAGLTIANRLAENGVESFCIVDKEEDVGGLCRSRNVDGSPFDIGGGHFLDVRRPITNSFLFKFMPEDEWNIFDRNSKIKVENCYIDHPIEANIWQFPISEQVEYLKSIANAGVIRGEKKPKKFVDWIYWKLGVKIADDYMIPYNKKMFGENLNSLGTYWLEKLPDVSFEETLQSCLEKKPYGKEPGHARFYYPKKYGYGELWRRMGEMIKSKVYLSEQVIELDYENRKVTTNNNTVIEAENIITTVPWMSFNIKNIPLKIKKIISELKFTSVITTYHEESLDTKAHWIYYPDSNLIYHRILVRHNFLPGSKGYWTESNKSRVTKGDLKDKTFYHINEYAYPMNTIGKVTQMQELLSWAKGNKIFAVGRWGEHSHYNSDYTVEKALFFANGLN